MTTITVNPHPHPSCDYVTEYVFKGLDAHIPIGRPGKLCAVMLLDKYRDSSYVNKLNRRRHRMLNRSTDYTFEPMNPRTFVADIVDINHSKDVRAGGPMKPHYLTSVEQRGGYPDRYYHPSPVSCRMHSLNNFFGVFMVHPGYKQGNIVTNKRLLAYACIHMAGDIAMYSLVIGHGDYLSHGVMTRLQVGITEWLLTFDNIKYWLMSAWSDGGDGSGLQDWKKEHLFEPIYLQR